MTKAPETPAVFTFPFGVSFDCSLPATEEQALLHVGSSRARVRLVIVATETTMERVAAGTSGEQPGLARPR